MLDRLVRRTIFAQTDRIMREYKDRAQLHQRRHTQGIATVIREGQKRRTERNVAAMQRNAIHDCAHAKFTHTVIDVVARLVGTNSNAFFPVGEIGSGQICRPAKKFRQAGCKRLNRILAGLASRDVFLFLDAGVDERRDRLLKRRW